MKFNKTLVRGSWGIRRHRGGWTEISLHPPARSSRKGLAFVVHTHLTSLAATTKRQDQRTAHQQAGSKGARHEQSITVGAGDGERLCRHGGGLDDGGRLNGCVRRRHHGGHDDRTLCSLQLLVGGSAGVRADLLGLALDPLALRRGARVCGLEVGRGDLLRVAVRLAGLRLLHLAQRHVVDVHRTGHLDTVAGSLADDRQPLLGDDNRTGLQFLAGRLVDELDTVGRLDDDRVVVLALATLDQRVDVDRGGGLALAGLLHREGVVLQDRQLAEAVAEAVDVTRDVHRIGGAHRQGERLGVRLGTGRVDGDAFGPHEITACALALVEGREHVAAVETVGERVVERDGGLAVGARDHLEVPGLGTDESGRLLGRRRLRGVGLDLGGRLVTGCRVGCGLLGALAGRRDRGIGGLLGRGLGGLVRRGHRRRRRRGRVGRRCLGLGLFDRLVGRDVLRLGRRGLGGRLLVGGLLAGPRGGRVGGRDGGGVDIGGGGGVGRHGSAKCQRHRSDDSHPCEGGLTDTGHASSSRSGLPHGGWRF